MCGCNQKKKPVSNVPSSTLSSSGNFTQESLAKVVQSNDKSQMVTLEYIGPLAESFRIRGRTLVDGRFLTYKFGNNEYHRAQVVLLADAEFLISQRNEHNQPNYRIVGMGTAQETLDPSAFLGQPITT